MIWHWILVEIVRLVVLILLVAAIEHIIGTRQQVFLQSSVCHWIINVSRTKSLWKLRVRSRWRVTNLIILRSILLNSSCFGAMSGIRAWPLSAFGPRLTSMLESGIGCTPYGTIWMHTCRLTKLLRVMLIHLLSNYLNWLLYPIAAIQKEYLVY